MRPFTSSGWSRVQRTEPDRPSAMHLNANGEISTPLPAISGRTDKAADKDSRLSMLEAQVSELTTRLARVESGSTPKMNMCDLIRRDTMHLKRPTSSSSSATSLSEYSTSSSDGQNSPTLSVSLPFALKFSVLDSKHRDQTPDRTKALWKHYVHNIDPLFKIVHLPTIEPLFVPPTTEPKDIPHDLRALKWAICFASSATQELSKSTPSPPSGLGPLSKMYQHSLETSLAKSRFLATPTLPAIQALAIYLSLGSTVLDQTYIWSLTAILVRLAFKLSLHHDPQHHPFREAEYRRRLWWHICTLDASTASANSTDPLIYERQMTTGFPVPIQDSALNTPTPPPSNVHAPDTFPPLLRFEITYYLRAILFSPTFSQENGFPLLTLDGKLSIISSLQKTLEEKFYRKCHCRSPTCTLAMLESKIFVAGLTLQLRDQHSSSSLSAEHLLTSCTSILEASSALRADPALAAWSWLWQGYVSTEMEAAETCLSTLANSRTRPAVTGRAWLAVDGFFNAWKEREGMAGERWRGLQALREKAIKVRASMVSPLGRHEGVRRSLALPSGIMIPQTTQKRTSSCPVVLSDNNTPRARRTTEIFPADVSNEDELTFGPPLRSFSDGMC